MRRIVCAGTLLIWSNNADTIAFTKTVQDSDGEKYSQIFVVDGL
ncbi:MAG: hypothetical protein ACIAQZ_10950 [Sedimentisphaeraceae bacterium JB056]